MPPGPYERTGAQNWYPAASKVVNTPKTVLVPVEYELGFLVDGITPKGMQELLAGLGAAADSIGGYPVFFRTGQTSCKHGWERARCVVRNSEDFPTAIAAVIEHSLLGFPEQAYHTLMVRQLIPTRPIFHAFARMPVTREFRFFVEGGQISHVQPYWPEMAVADYLNDDAGPDWRKHLREISRLLWNEYAYLSVETLKIADVVPGDWSVDWLCDKDGGWWMIDMADASVSYRWQPDFQVVRG